MKSLCILFFLVATASAHAQPAAHKVKNLKVTILSTMMAQAGMGEWGFSALVEADSVRILFDSGGREGTVLNNARELEVNLTNIPMLILSHNHNDHTLGWIPLRNAVSATSKRALSVTHVAQGFFDTRVTPNGENRRRQKDSLSYVQTAGKVVQHSSFAQISPGIFVTGPVPRTYPEKNYPPNAKKMDRKGTIIEDNIPEDMSLIIQTEQGLVLISGCGHSGIINTITYARKNLGDQPVYAAIGGFHLLDNPDDQIKWTAGELKKSGIRYFVGAHCTGVEPVYQIREWANLKRGECIVGSVGATFSLDKGLEGGPLTR